MDERSQGGSHSDAGQDAGQAALAEARRAVERHDLDAAASALERAEQAVPDHWEVHHLRGVVAARRQQWDDAEERFQRAHSLNPCHPAPLTNLGNLRIERGQYDEAVRYFQQALAVDPDYPNAHHNLAVAYRRMGRLDESVRHLKRAQRLEGRRAPGSGGASAPAAPAGWMLLVGAIATAAIVLWTLSQRGAP